MPVYHPDKTVSHRTLDCDGMTTVTLCFDAEAELLSSPADIILVMDRSGSMTGTPLTYAVRAAKELVRTVVKASGSTDGITFENGSHMGLVSFSDTASADTSLTEDAGAIYAALECLESGGATNHQAAFVLAHRMLSESAAKRRILILFTDGESNIGEPDPAAEAIKQDGIEIFCAGLLADPSSLDRWASEPAKTHVASTEDVTELQHIFHSIIAEAVRAGALDMKLREQLNPDFKLVHIGQPTHGTVTVLNPQTLLWTAEVIGEAGRETASLSFDIMHIGESGGEKAVNASVSYQDRLEQSLVFPSPTVEISCGADTILPEPCPHPVSFLVEGCRDTVSVNAGEIVPGGLGRIVQVNAVVKNVCPGRRVAAAVILTETDAEGVEHARGMKTILIPAQEGLVCRDIQLKCISFVVPEELDPSGNRDAVCNARTFCVRVLANYADAEFVCCDPGTVIL